MRVVVIGAGYVGLTLGVVAANCGHYVEFVEKDVAKLSKLRLGKSHFYEPGIDELLVKHVTSSQIKGHERIEQIEPARDSTPIAYVITMGTPLESTETRSSGHKIIEVAIEQIGPKLREQDIVCLRSTVEIGFCERLLQRSEIKNLGFCPERTIEGNALHELLELPQIIATDSEYTFEVCKDVFRFSPRFVRLSSFKEGEAVKLICNTHRDWNFAFSNLCALIANEKGFSVTNAIEAANSSYPRAKVPTPGLVGGPCLEKDPYIFSLGLSKTLASYAVLSREINQAYFTELLKNLLCKCHPGSTVTIIGAAFKGQPITSDTRGSMIYPLITGMVEHGFDLTRISVYDPAVMAIDGFGDIYISNEISWLYATEADHYIITTNHAFFYSQSFKQFVGSKKGRITSFWPDLIDS